MRTNVCAWGASAGIRIPKAVMQQVGLSIGDAFEMKVSGDTLVLRPYRSKYTLAGLLKQCDLDAPPPELDGWDDMAPVGQEIL